MSGSEGAWRAGQDVNKSRCVGAVTETFPLHNSYRRQSYWFIFIVARLVCSCDQTQRMKRQADVFWGGCCRNLDTIWALRADWSWSSCFVWSCLLLWFPAQRSGCTGWELYCLPVVFIMIVVVVVAHASIGIITPKSLAHERKSCLQTRWMLLYCPL